MIRGFNREPGESVVSQKPRRSFKIEQWSSEHDTQMHSISVTWEVIEMHIIKPHTRPTESNLGVESNNLWFLPVFQMILWETARMEEPTKSSKC